ncbi:LysR family transcriptional regulator [Pseudomonas syringae]|uniref:Transcriptional regulator, LysR family n=1 Tax=Pseudomonas syringae pv. syringae (strain B728a) TaxID=205918 RepID=Q4ZQZ3_PSEU2|nr:MULTISPECIES: LysR family transcriptional regulator [Pseudomonas]AAY38429.1 transcriptional regulator, LysR family [Pseudomonas syringae pv. syringae B728a]EGH72568.1 helix-turn-helix, Fis-type [Pseudomonas syringae pv. aceris str. M302273]KOG03714.1 Transcriptional regulator, LysR family [Pseudomonas syringae pv. aceris]KTB78228.1 LysR family transcriptional regulator [Pseudomonas syringae ICMP 13102]MCA5970862.1 LysR family transcriptional regulator [Pseudomonas sp. P135]
MIAIEDLRLAVTLSRCESLSAAARILNVSPPALSMRLRKLETQLGITLASRDARRLSLTADGERFARESAQLLEQLEALPESFRQRDERLVGTLRLAAPFGYGRQRIAPLLARFARLHPQLCLQLDLRETPWPDRHDSDAVIHIGSLNDSQWIAMPLAQNHRWLCASPAYIEQHGVPSTPEQLAGHRCICIRENDEDVTLWHLSKGQTKKTLRIEPALLSNDGSVARRWAEQGLGIVLRSQWDVSDAIASGRLVRVLADWQLASAPINLLVPVRKHRSARVQALTEFLETALKA